MNQKHTFTSDFAWQLPYLPAVRARIAPFVIVQSSEQVDREEAGDMIVDGGTVAIRLRRNGVVGSTEDYAGLYPFDFTIRRSRSNGMLTEAHKIMKGYGTWIFYGHVRNEEIFRWMFLSLDAFRDSFKSNSSPYKGQTRTNTNDRGATSFTVFDVRKMPNILIGCSWSSAVASDGV